MASKSRFGSLLCFVFCSGVFVLEWFLRARAGAIHPMLLLVAGAGFTLGLLGLISPEKVQLTAENKLQPLANQVSLLGFGVGGFVWFLLK